MKPDDIKAQLRKRHNLKDNADVHLISTKLLVSEVAGDPYKFTARITTDALDRQDEVVIPSGGSFAEFLTSGAWFWNHDYSAPVGFPDKTKQIIKSDSFVECGGIFMKRPEGWQGDFMPDFVREFVCQGVAAGINPGVSIGFIPVESRRPTKSDVARFGEGVAMVHSKWKLLEVSIAPVQANQEAVITAVGKGLIKAHIAKAVGYVVPEAPPSPPPIQRKRCLLLMLPKATPVVDVAATVQRELRRQVYKRFGRVYLP